MDHHALGEKEEKNHHQDIQQSVKDVSKQSQFTITSDIRVKPSQYRHCKEDLLADASSNGHVYQCCMVQHTHKTEIRTTDLQVWCHMTRYFH
jgi:hypothetical protein